MDLESLCKEINYVNRELGAIQIKIDKASNAKNYPNDKLYSMKHIIDYFMMEYYRTACRKKQLELLLLDILNDKPITEDYRDIDEGFYTVTDIIQDDIGIKTKIKKPRRPIKVEKEKQSDNTDNEIDICLKKITIENHSLLSSFDVGLLIMALKKVPAKISRLFFNKGYRLIAVTNDKLGYHVAGRCNYNKRTIELACDVSNKYDRTMYHELGHMIDLNYDNNTFISNSAQFLTIYNKEKRHLIYLQEDMYEYCIRDSQEYFAESFAEYMESGFELKRNAPKTYEFIKDYINTL